MAPPNKDMSILSTTWAYFIVMLFQRAAGQGHAIAPYNPEVMYRDGQGVPQGYEKAFAWFRRACHGTLQPWQNTRTRVRHAPKRRESRGMLSKGSRRKIFRRAVKPGNHVLRWPRSGPELQGGHGVLSKGSRPRTPQAQYGFGHMAKTCRGAPQCF